MRRLDLYSTVGLHMVSWENYSYPVSYLSCTFGWRGPRCRWVTSYLTVWYPVWRYVEYSQGTAAGSAAFDCDSIMLYPYRKIQPGALHESCRLRNSDNSYAITSDGYYLTKNYSEISPQDAATAASLIASPVFNIFWGW